MPRNPLYHIKIEKRVKKKIKIASWLTNFYKSKMAEGKMRLNAHGKRSSKTSQRP